MDSHQLEIKLIVNTHAHIDHINANSELKERTQALLYIHSAGKGILTDPQRNLSSFLGAPFSSVPADELLADGDVLEVGDLRLQVIHTPGHSPDSICLAGDGYVFSGDLLFAGSIGRYDFPGSSYPALMKSLEKVMELDDSTIVYPGHGPETTIGDERRTNPFLQ